MDIQDIQADIQRIASEPSLYQEENFAIRTESLDFIEFHILDRIDSLGSHPELAELRLRAEALRSSLEQVDQALFTRIRADIRAGGCRGSVLASLFDTYIADNTRGRKPLDLAGYDSLDDLMNGILLNHPDPGETREREAEMLYYQQTPARIILELIRRASFTPQNQFFDLGSGLGQVPIMVHLLSGAFARGVEFEPAYCDFASACARELCLTGAEFINIDAREADYTRGTDFFLYTPFQGALLQEVLDRIRRQTSGRSIRIFSYGPCTLHIARQPWLRCDDVDGPRVSSLCALTSLV